MTAGEGGICWTDNFITMSVNPEELSSCKRGQPLQDPVELAKYMSLVKQVASILRKSKQGQGSADASVKNLFLSLSPFFVLLRALVSQQFSKNLLKAGYIHQIKQSRRICEQGSKITNLYLPLAGKWAISQAGSIPDLPLLIVYQNLLALAANVSPKRKVSLNFSELKTEPCILRNFDATNIFSGEGSLLVDGLFGKEGYSQSLFSLQECWVFSISLDCFFAVLKEQNKNREGDKIALFRRIPCFQEFKDDELRLILKEVRLLDFAKDEYVFREGESCDEFYLLVEGSVRLTKSAKLFKENPNTLYCNRTMLTSGSSRSGLPYADFSLVYNYTPKTKVIQIGVISALDLFGQEEIIFNIKRELSARVDTNRAKVYALRLRDIEAGSLEDKKTVTESFVGKLYEQLSKKRILYRQQKLSDVLKVENRHSMDYFYQYDSKVTARSHRESIRKINDVITPRPAWKKETDNGLFVKPFYDTFNFPKAVEPVRLKNASLMNNRASKELFKFTKTLSKEEMALAKVLHTTEHISSKIEAQEHFLLQKQKARPEINLANPLFDIAYFAQQKKDNARIHCQKGSRRSGSFFRRSAAGRPSIKIA